MNINEESVLAEESNEVISSHKLVSYVPILTVLVGIFISLPAFYTGAKIVGGLGLIQGTKSFFIGGLILAVIARICASIGAFTRLSTYKIIQHSFGKKGAILINLIFSCSLFGWFGVNSALFGESVFQSLGMIKVTFIPTYWYIIIGGILMVSTAIFGFKALNKLANLAVPVLAISLIVLVAISLFDHSHNLDDTFVSTVSLGKAISVVIGSSIVGAILTPDYCRYARTTTHAVIACSVTFGLAFPLILVSAAIPALATGETDVVPIIKALNVGAIGLLVVIFTAWTTNNANLYSGSLGLSTVFTSLKYWHLVVFTGSLGTLFAILGIMESFVPFLLFLGVTMPPVAGVYITHHFFFSDHQYTSESLDITPEYSIPALLAWVLASSLGYFSINDYITFTMVPAIDSLVCSGVIYFALKKTTLLMSKHPK